MQPEFYAPYPPYTLVHLSQRILAGNLTKLRKQLCQMLNQNLRRRRNGLEILLPVQVGQKIVVLLAVRHDFAGEEERCKFVEGQRGQIKVSRLVVQMVRFIHVRRITKLAQVPINSVLVDVESAKNTCPVSRA